MMEPQRLLTLAAALNLTLGVAFATAQTLLVRNAPPGSTIELVLNATPIGSTKVDESGVVTLPINLSKHVNKPETDAQIFVDVCDNVRRVLIVERALQPPAPEAGCRRRDMGGLFLVRQISTLVVGVKDSPTLLLRQGSVSLKPPRVWTPAPTGFVLFGGGAFTKITNVVDQACGTVTDCTGDASGFSYAAGAAYWITPYLAAEGTYVKPAEVTATGTAGNFRFNSSFDADVLTAVGKVGVPLGPFRPYGQIGGTYHQARFTTSQTLTDATENATQTFSQKTRGWSWVFGGGAEIWITRWLAVYGEVERGALKGPVTDEDEGDGTIDDRFTFILFGGRIRIGG
jgi:hypothetical protein